MNEQLIRWDDLRIVLAINRAGSLSGAARALHCSHATVFRRLNDMEQRLGVTLFERDHAGYGATTAGSEVAETAETVESQILSAERRIVGRDFQLSGTIRVTTTDTLLGGLLTPILSRFRVAHPDITLDVVASNQLFNLSKRDADVAIRPSSSPPDLLVGKKVGQISMAIYGLSARHKDVDENQATSAATAWIGPDPRMGFSALNTWMSEKRLDQTCHYRADSMMAMLWAVREGVGCGVLPCYLGDADENLVRLGPPIAALETDLWLLTHPDLRRVTRIRTFLTFLADAIRDQRARLQIEASR